MWTADKSVSVISKRTSALKSTSEFWRKVSLWKLDFSSADTRELKDTGAHDRAEVAAWKRDVFLCQTSFRCLFSELCWLTSPCHQFLSVSLPLSLCVFKENVEHEWPMWLKREGKGTKEWLGFPPASASLWPLTPEHYISRSQGLSGSENNGREAGNTPCHPCFAS